MQSPELSLFDGSLTTSAVHNVSTEDISIHWHGFIYIDGQQGQHESVEQLLLLLKELPVEEAVASLKGCFFCIVEYADGNFDTFVDNSGMYAAYVCDTGVSRSFLSLVDSLGLGIEDLDSIGVAEFAQTGNLYNQKTFFQSIKKIGFNHIFRFEATAVTYQRLNKNVPDITAQPLDKSLKKTFDGLATALQGTRVSVDVTGGLDTRTLIAGLVAADVEFETAVSGDDTHIDVQIGKEVAESISRPFYVTPHSMGSFHDDLEATLVSLDGLKAHLLTQHRILQLQHARGERDIQLCIRGIGGGHFRDFKWAQDFPFYRSSRTRFERMDRLRVEVIRVPNKLFSESFQTRLQQARIERLENYKQYRQKLNTQSYDMIDCHESLQNSHSRAMSVSATTHVAVYCPLAEIHRLQHAYHCPRSLRFGALFQKSFITQCSPTLARVRTSYGATASTEVFYLLSGSVKLTITNMKRLVRKLAQTYIGKSPFIFPTTTLAGSEELLRQSEHCDKAVDALKRHDILSTEIDKSLISDRFIERFVCLGWFLMRLETNARQNKKLDS